MAFLMHGDSRTWACTNRLTDLKTVARNWKKITAEVTEHLNHAHMHNYKRSLVGEERLHWKTAHLRAVQTLQEQFGPEWQTAPGLVAFLCSDEALDEITPFFRCALSPACCVTPVKAAHWEETKAEFESYSRGGVPSYLTENFWEIPAPEAGA